MNPAAHPPKTRPAAARRHLVHMVLMLLLASCGWNAVWAQQSVKITATPSELKVGEVLQLRVDISDYTGGLQAPAFPPIAGFSMSGTATAVQSINGKQTFSQGMNYVARTPGTTQVPPFEVRVNGKSYQFKGKTITVAPNPNAPTAPDLGFDSRVDQFTGDPSQPPDIRLEAQLNTTNCYAGEEVRLEIKCLVNQADVPRIHLSYEDVAEMMATFKLSDCWVVQEQLSSAHAEAAVRDGKRYVAVTIAQLRVYPLKAGTITLPVLRMGFTAAMRKGNSPALVYNKFYAQSDSRTLTAKPLPPPPASLSGQTVAVGNFVLSDRLASSRVPALTPFTYTLTLVGRGNLSLLPPPIPPANDTSFEWEQTNVEVQYLPFERAESGTVVYTYSLTPRREGVHRLQPPHFLYFNPETGRYDSLIIQGTEVLVLPAYLSAVGDDFFAQRLADADATLSSKPWPLPALLAALLAFALLAALLYRYGKQLGEALKVAPKTTAALWQNIRKAQPAKPKTGQAHDPFA